MGNRLLLSLLGAVGVAVAVLVAISSGSGGTRVAMGAITPSASPAPYTLTKTADAEEAFAGERIGFTIELRVLDTNGIVWYIEDNLPPGPGLHWTVDTFSGAASCSIVSQAPEHLECVGNGGAGETHIVVHVVSQTTSDSPGDYENTALAGYPGFEDLSAHDSVTVVSPTPSPTATPSPSPTPTPEPFLPRVFGGHDSQGDNVVIILPPPGGNTVTFDGFEIPLGPDCSGQTDTFVVPGILLGNDNSFQKQDGTHNVQGQIMEFNGLEVAQGNITVGDGTNCSNTLAFVAEQSDRALLLGDIDCSWPELYSSAAAAGVASPQGQTATPTPSPAPNPNKGITVKDVIETLKWVAGLAEDSPPLDCPLLDAAFPTPVPGTATPTVAPTSTARPVHLQGDVDCDGATSDKDVLEMLMFMAGLDQPSCGGVKVGQFWLLDK